jgi:hypothetical protein
MMIKSNATTWSVTWDCHSDDRNIFMLQATEYVLLA